MSGAKSKTDNGDLLLIYPLTERDCLLALHRHIKRRRAVRSNLMRLICHCFCPAEEFIIESVENFQVHRITLESVLEQRIRYPSIELSMDKVADWGGHQPVLGKGREFESSELLVPDPKATGRIAECSECNGSGRVGCSSCQARGHVECDCWFESDQEILPSESVYGTAPCDLCDGCTHCYRCLNCEGRASVDCSVCDGRGKSVHLPRTLVKRSVLRNCRLLGTPAGLDESLVTSAEGLVVDFARGTCVDEAAEMLRKLHGCRVANIWEAQLTDQRLRTDIVPVAKAQYYLSNKQEGTFWVLGASGDLCHCPGFPWVAFGAADNAYRLPRD